MHSFKMLANERKAKRMKMEMKQWKQCTGPNDSRAALCVTQHLLAAFCAHATYSRFSVFLFACQSLRHIRDPIHIVRACREFTLKQHVSVQYDGMEIKTIQLKISADATTIPSKVPRSAWTSLPSAPKFQSQNFCSSIFSNVRFYCHSFILDLCL